MNSPAPPPITVCLLTGMTRAAVATVAVEGQRAGALLEQVFTPAGPGPIQIDQVRYGLWQGAHTGAAQSGEAQSGEAQGGEAQGGGVAAESVVVCRSPDRADAPGLERWEIHCHGGVVAAGRIIEDLRQLGAVVLPAERWRQWQGQPLLIREASEVLGRTTSPRTAAIALDQVRGAMTTFVQQSLRLIDDCGAGGVPQVAAAAAERLRFAAIGLHLDRPWRVVLAGPPNVGKSSLINAILGYRRSITVDQPGTTRDVLEAQTVIEGWPIRLSDTAGIHEAAQCEIESLGIELARRELEQADLILWVRDAAAQQHLPTPPAAAVGTAPRLLEVVNKIDLLGAATAESIDSVMTSATTGAGVEQLRRQIAACLVAEAPPPLTAVPLTGRQVVCLQRLAAATDEVTARAALGELSGD